MENGTVKFSGEGSVKLNRPMLWKTGMAWITDTAEKQRKEGIKALCVEYKTPHTIHMLSCKPQTHQHAFVN